MAHMRKKTSICTALALTAVMALTGCSSKYKRPELTEADRRALAQSEALTKTPEKTGTPLSRDQLRATTPIISPAAAMEITGVVNDTVSLDIRTEAQEEAALSYGARGGLSFRSHEIAEELSGHEKSLDEVFDFRRLLMRAPSGLLIEAPIVSEAENALIVTKGGIEAAVADRIYNIQKNAQIVTAPRNWRQYIQPYWDVEIEPPPQILWPQSPKESARWDAAFERGWKAGIEQANQIFESNLERLVADFNGMVRYRMMVAQGMISEPYALHEDRGVTGGKDELRVGDRALRITGQSEFKTGYEEWQPADR